MASKTASSKKDLWLRIRDYHFDDLVPPHLVDHVAETFGGANASTRAFATKVSKKTGWDLDFTLRAIDEYKKFVFLGVTADFFVTPPKVIDQVWHEHLLFTRGYREFCRSVLRHDLDHNPELVATGDQTAVFHAQYDATLERSEAEFNTAPPSDIWGTAKFRSRRGETTATLKRKKSDSSGDYLHTYFDSGTSSERGWRESDGSYDSGDGHGDSNGGGGNGGGG